VGNLFLDDDSVNVAGCADASEILSSIFKAKMETAYKRRHYPERGFVQDIFQNNMFL
jgi:hypothetical protein